MKKSAALKNIGFCLTGSFCTLSRAVEQAERMAAAGYNVVPVISFAVGGTDTRFGAAADFKRKLTAVTGNPAVDSIVGAEPLGPRNPLDVMLVAPCTGNTLAKIACAVTDTPVTMAVKAHMRNGRPTVIAVSSNDALGLSFKNIGTLMASKDIYFVPFGQDDCENKPKSLTADFDLLLPAAEAAFAGRQLQPLFRAF